MIISKKQILADVKECIKKLEDRFGKNHEYFMDMKELDLTAYLYHLIARKRYFLTLRKGRFGDDEPFKTKLLQIESSTNTKVRVGKGRFDLTIYDPKKLVSNKLNFPACYFIAVEMKWLGSLSKTALNDIEKEIKNKLDKKSNHIKHGFLLIFDKDQKFTKKFKHDVRKFRKKHSKLKIHFIPYIDRKK